MRRLVVPVLLLSVLWVLLQGEPTVGNVAAGLLVAVGVVLVDRDLRPARRHRVRPVAAAVLTADLVCRLIRASQQVAMAVLRPTERSLSAGVVAAPLRSDCDLVAVVVSDLITLTPGTVTVDIRDDRSAGGRVLLVHVLGLDDPDDVRRDVSRLERRVLTALPPLAGHRHPEDEAGSEQTRGKQARGEETRS